jgi:hypothetical protein
MESRDVKYAQVKMMNQKMIVSIESMQELDSIGD